MFVLHLAAWCLSFVCDLGKHMGVLALNQLFVNWNLQIYWQRVRLMLLTGAADIILTKEGFHAVWKNLFQ